jgi:methyl-accepting chemotaxis protein
VIGFDVNKNLKSKVICGIVLLLLGTGGVIFSVAALSSYAKSKESYLSFASNHTRQVDQILLTQIRELKKLTLLLADDPSAPLIGDIRTSYVQRQAASKSVPDAGDAAGRLWKDKLAQVVRSHPGVSPLAASASGGFVLGVDTDLPPGFDARQKLWYKAATEYQGDVVVTKAYRTGTGTPMINVARTVARDGKPVGAVGVAVSLQFITDAIKSYRIGSEGFIILVQNDGVVLADPLEPANAFKNVTEAYDGALAAALEPREGGAHVMLAGKKYTAVLHSSPELGWKYLGLVSESEIVKPIYGELYRLGASVLACLALGVLGFWLALNRLIIIPLRRVRDFLSGIAQGRYDDRINSGRADEIGEIFSALDQTAGRLADNTEEINRRTAEAGQKAQLAETAMREAETARLRADQSRSEGLLHAVARMEAVVGSLAGASDRLSAVVDRAAGGSQTQRGRTAEAATAMEEMNATVLEMSRSAGQAAESTEHTRVEAVKGAALVGSLVASIGRVDEKSRELKVRLGDLGHKAEGIGRIMGVIADIADQTNLLALNAAIEAARAGDAGRGFAVVADEVRKLAEKTMTATQEVGEAVRGIQSGTGESLGGMEQASQAVEESTLLARDAGDSLASVVRLADANAAQVHGIAAASEEQSAACEQISRSTAEIDAIAGENSSAMADAAQAVNELAAVARDLRQVIDELRRGAGQHF